MDTWRRRRFDVRKITAVLLLLVAAGAATACQPPVAPTITSVAPSTGPTTGGTVVTITGTRFAEPTTVTFGGTAATSVVVNSKTSLTATAPAGAAGVVDVVVTGPKGTVTAPDAFTYVAPAPTTPTITSVSPGFGPTSGGTGVTITGTNLDGATSVTFGGSPATVVGPPTATSLQVFAPAGAAGVVDVVVTTPAGTATATNAFTYTQFDPSF